MNKDQQLQGLYDMLGFTPEKENVFEEQRLRRAMDEHSKRVRRNKDKYIEVEKRYFSCKMYDPCPICDKCNNKASHIYVRCQNCEIPICQHTYKDKCFMIRRSNFKLKVDNQVFQKLRELSLIAEEIANGRISKLD